MTDLTGDGRADLAGFGDAGLHTALATGGGGFAAPILALGEFGYTAGWRVDRHPRLFADLTGDGRPDLIGFGEDGVRTALNAGDGRFAPSRLVVPDLGYTAGGWRVERNPRFAADLTGDGRADLIGFGDDGVLTALGNGDGTFATPRSVLADLSVDAGGWLVERHPRFVVDLTGDGRASLVGFGDDGVVVAQGNGDGTFSPPKLVLPAFGFAAGGWRTTRHIRILADITGDGRPDIVGFGEDGVWVALNDGGGGFGPARRVIDNFAIGAGGWQLDRHPRLLADVTGDGRADIVGFGNTGVLISRSNGDGTFGAPALTLTGLGYRAGDWRTDRHPRFAADLTGDGRADLIGFGEDGVWTAPNAGDGTFRTVRIRRDAWDLDTWDPTLLHYARAVRAMQSRPISDPTSWAYQAAVHGRTGATPSGADWNLCQHGSWHFLPWHRGYLWHFERIVRAEVIRQGGPADWALPYWDYGTQARAALPPAFRERTLPDGTPNPLFTAQRAAGINAGGRLPASATSSANALRATAFAPGFGGGRTSPQHFFNAYGELEFTPHNDIHSLIGGLMGDPNQAALDPIFWLHHANIDRLWTVWLRQGGGRANPADAAWRDQSWTFRDPSGNRVTITTGAMLDTDRDLEYVYQDGVAAAPLPSVRLASVQVDEPEFVGASFRPVSLSGRAAAVEVPIDARSATEAARVQLNLEDIEADANPEAVYEVFARPLGAPGAVPRYLGNVSFFGITHTGPAAHHGFRRTFDITDWVGELRGRGEWSDQGVTVSFRPIGLATPEETATAADDARAVPVRVGRVSIFYGA
ncbi:tyrosinase family protein [Catenuloplanes japonicus]|uniref:tyrosinase family protein n=1 Tax=Catenuloplanes japonicus TaxID=33876 RepID=UPI0018DDE1AB|nr:tyrosinase family protein [Catenuloplanes japonicus]